MVYILNTTIIIFSFALMEGVAWFAHKYVMHGFLWVLHKDHHLPHKGKLERNDFFALIFAIPAWLFTMFGVMDGNDYKLYIGIGITLYGVAYFLVHDGLIHSRIPLLSKTKNRWLQALKRGHAAHHRHLKKEDGECFGMLVVPPKFLKKG
jgi:beta-carotene 3-hydroxylase